MNDNDIIVSPEMFKAWMFDELERLIEDNSLADRAQIIIAMKVFDACFKYIKGENIWS